jgi:hypothetical protein
LVTLLLLATWTLPPRTAEGQESAAEVIYSRVRVFDIPFQAGPGQERLRQLQLYVSTDRGRTWQQAAVATPQQNRFRFNTDRDGLYWFSVQTLDQGGRHFPAAMDGATPTLKVVVDTQPPSVQLRPLSPRGNEVGVAWDVRDDNLDLALPDALRLEYRMGTSPAWLPLRPQAGAVQFFWNPETNAVVEVRLRARDRAGNWGEDITSVSLASQPAAASQGAPDQGFRPNPPPGPKEVQTPPERRLVNSKQISLNYEFKDVGPSGVSTVELWYTQDGQSWQKWPLQARGENGAPRSPLVFTVHDEGLYGFTLVAKSGVGLGERPPQVGDTPQVWVEVDMTKPVVLLQSVVVGQGVDKGKLSVYWRATDKNLDAQPITIAYKDEKAGDWVPIAQKQANTGRFVWVMPAEGVPYEFLVRVQAVDRAGNVGEAITASPVKVDLAQPKVKILTVEPVGK